jgi:predicted DNA-binding protein
MATTKPRITITLEPRVYELLRSISENSHQPMSAFVGELLSESIPVLERMAVTFQQIVQVKDQQLQQIASAADDAQRSLEPVLQQVLGQYDIFMADAGLSGAVTVTENGSGSAGVVVGATSDARPGATTSRPRTNRGATNSTPKARKPNTGKASKGS